MSVVSPLGLVSSPGMVLIGGSPDQCEVWCAWVPLCWQVAFATL